MTEFRLVTASWRSYSVSALTAQAVSLRFDTLEYGLSDLPRRLAGKRETVGSRIWVERGSSTARTENQAWLG